MKYILYGTQGRTATDKEIGSCIAYSESDSRERFYEVNGNNDFIDSLGYAIWD